MVAMEWNRSGVQKAVRLGKRRDALALSTLEERRLRGELGLDSQANVHIEQFFCAKIKESRSRGHNWKQEKRSAWKYVFFSFRKEKNGLLNHNEPKKVYAASIGELKKYKSKEIGDRRCPTCDKFSPQMGAVKTLFFFIVSELFAVTVTVEKPL